MNPVLEVLQDLTARLERGGFRYMLTGSMALTCYAPPRMTGDIDLVVELEVGDIKKVLAVFSPDYYVSDMDVARALSEHGMFNVLHNRASIKADIIVRKNEPYRLEEFERRRRATVAGFNVWIVSKEDLILSKLVWARESRSEMQLRDVRSLLAGDVDRDYLERWADKLLVAQQLVACMNAGYDS